MSYTVNVSCYTFLLFLNSHVRDFDGQLSASVYIKMKKPNAAIRDATAALEVVLLFFNSFAGTNDCLPLHFINFQD